MKITSLNDFFSRCNYDWEKDKEEIKHICSLTKTRPDEEKTEFEFSYGMEQTFFIKAAIEHLNASSFFEIGTGRGTASYAVSLCSKIKNITTVDIIPFDQKCDSAINYKPARLSNKDIFEMVEIPTKDKIEFKHVSDYPLITALHSNCYDVCFIDGCHEDKNVIMQDFNICYHLVKDQGYIIWDDYDPDQFEVKNVIESIISEKGFDCELVEFRGHLFNGEKGPELGAGEVIMKIQKS